MRFVLTALAAVLALSVVACSAHKTTTFTDSNGNTTTVDTSSGPSGSASGSGSMTVTTKEGSMSIGANNVDTSKLGVPVYPGATSSGGGSMSVSSKEGTGQMVTLTTNDSFAKVEGWYKAQLPAGSEKLNMTAGNTSTAEFQVGKDSDPDQKSVSITSDGSKTTIMLTHKVSTSNGS